MECCYELLLESLELVLVSKRQCEGVGGVCAAGTYHCSFCLCAGAAACCRDGLYSLGLGSGHLRMDLVADSEAVGALLRSPRLDLVGRCGLLGDPAEHFATGGGIRR